MEKALLVEEVFWTVTQDERLDAVATVSLQDEIQPSVFLRVIGLGANAPYADVVLLKKELEALLELIRQAEKENSQDKEAK